MVKALFDTNILIDYLNAVGAARDELARYGEKAISIITWMEVMVGPPREAVEATRNFLSAFELVALDEGVAGDAIELRRAHGIKLPDAIIWASARHHGMLLVTRNTKDFPPDDPGVRCPYDL